MPSPVMLCHGLLRFLSSLVRMKLSRHLKQPLNYILTSAAWDASLVLVPGMMGLATGLRMRTDRYAPSYLQVICHSVTVWPHYAPSILLLSSVIAIFLGIFRFAVIRFNSKRAVFYYLCLLLTLALINLASGSASIYSGKKINIHLESSGLEQIRSIHEGVIPSFLNSNLEESWDVLQMQFSCCGVNGYNDYRELPGAKTSKEPLPRSCCTVHWKGEMAKINNYHQCQLDARLGVQDSTYINMPGCQQHLVVWLKHYLYAQIFVMIGGAFAQMCGVVYISVIYYGSASGLR